MKLAQSRTLRPSKMPSAMVAPVIFVGFVPRAGITLEDNQASFGPCWPDDATTDSASLRANGSRECAPDDRLREAIHAARQAGLLRRVAPRNDGNYSISDISAALPPAAAVLMVT